MTLCRCWPCLHENLATNSGCPYLHWICMIKHLWATYYTRHEFLWHDDVIKWKHFRDVGDLRRHPAHYEVTVMDIQELHTHFTASAISVRGPTLHIPRISIRLAGKTCRKISRNLEARKCGFRFAGSLWNITGTSAALLPRRLSNFRAI